MISDCKYMKECFIIKELIGIINDNKDKKEFKKGELGLGGLKNGI